MIRIFCYLLAGGICLMLPPTASSTLLPPNAYVIQQGNSNDDGGSDSVGQSFTTQAAGVISNIVIYANHLGAYNADVKIYQGDGLSGTLIHTKTMVPINSGVTVVTYNNGPTLLANTQYTFIFTPAAGTPTFSGVMWQINDGNLYAGGTAWFSGSNVKTTALGIDLKFSVQINGTPASPGLTDAQIAAQQNSAEVQTEDEPARRRNTSTPFVSGLNQRSRTFIQQFVLPFIGE